MFHSLSNGSGYNANLVEFFSLDLFIQRAFSQRSFLFAVKKNIFSIEQGGKMPLNWGHRCDTLWSIYMIINFVHFTHSILILLQWQWMRTCILYKCRKKNIRSFSIQTNLCLLLLMWKGGVGKEEFSNQHPIIRLLAKIIPKWLI